MLTELKRAIWVWNADVDSAASKSIKAVSVRSNRSTAMLARQALSSDVAKGIRQPPQVKECTLHRRNSWGKMHCVHSCPVQFSLQSTAAGQDMLPGGMMVQVVPESTQRLLTD